MSNEKILITGGTGFFGSHLIPALISNGKKVNVLSRKQDHNKSVFQWNVNNNYIDSSSLAGVGTIIHLAGASLADSRWTSSYKKEIIDSRVNSSRLLFETLKLGRHSVHTFISASAVGYYGNTGDVWIEEDFHAPEDFLSKTCILWEDAAHQFEKLGIRVVIFRTGLVLGSDGGALPVMARPVKFFAGTLLGSGKQYISWIHVDDLCRMYSFAVDDKKLHGVYNAVAPGPVTNKEFIHMIGKALSRPIWPIHAPSFALKLILGDKAVIVLDGQRVSSEKIRMVGYHFEHTDLQKNLRILLT